MLRPSRYPFRLLQPVVFLHSTYPNQEFSTPHLVLNVSPDVRVSHASSLRDAILTTSQRELKRLALTLATTGPAKALPTPRQIRLLFNGTYIATSTRASYIWEHPFYPQFYLPFSDVHKTLKTTSAHLRDGETFKTDDGKTVAQQLILTVNDRTIDKIIHFRHDLTGPAESLKSLVKFDFDSIDAWFEESTRILVHPKDPFKRVEVIQSSRLIRIFISDILVAESTFAQHLYETGLPARYYIPFTSLKEPGMLRPSTTRTKCPYKGEAEYYSLVVDGKEFEDIVWFYDRPTVESSLIQGLLCCKFALVSDSGAMLLMVR